MTRMNENGTNEIKALVSKVMQGNYSKEELSDFSIFIDGFLDGFVKGDSK